MIKNHAIWPIFIVIFSVTNTANALTLKQVFDKALENTLTDKISDVRIEQSKESTKVSKSSYLPDIGLKGLYNKAESAVASKALGVTVSSNLYNGNRDSYSIKSKHIAENIQSLQKNIDRLNLYQNVIESFFNVIATQKDVSNIELLKKQSTERFFEIKKRVQIGRSRKGELLQAEAQLATVDAAFTNGKNLFDLALKKLSILTGIPEDQLYDNTYEEVLNLKSFDSFYASSINKDEVAVKKLKLDQLDQLVLQSRNHFFPKVDLSSNLYAYKEGSSSYKNSNWDVGLTLTLPLYEGGASQATYIEDVQSRMIAEYQYRDYIRELNSTVVSFYETYKRFYGQVAPNEKALDFAKKSYEETLKDYRLGVVSSLDVLSSLNLYLDRKRESEKNKILVVMNQKLLEANAGIMP